MTLAGARSAATRVGTEGDMRLARRHAFLAAGIAAAALAGGAALAQAQGIRRTVLQRTDVTGAEPTECGRASAEVAPRATIGRHIHPGFEVGYVETGELDLVVDGEPVRHLKAGESYHVAARRPHDGKNTGSTPARVIVTYVVEKGHPLATPVK